MASSNLICLDRATEIHLVCWKKLRTSITLGPWGNLLLFRKYYFKICLYAYNKNTTAEKLRCVSGDFINDKLTLGQMMAWRNQNIKLFCTDFLWRVSYSFVWDSLQAIAEFGDEIKNFVTFEAHNLRWYKIKIRWIGMVHTWWLSLHIFRWDSQHGIQ